jgi:endonuclease III
MPHSSQTKDEVRMNPRTQALLRRRDTPLILPWEQILSKLTRFYAVGDWRVPVLRGRGVDPFLILVSTILSRRTRDEVTERCTLRLMAAFPSADVMARAPLAKIRALISSVGLSRAKAREIRDASRIISTRHGGRVPDLESALLHLPGVGPKTAQAIRVFGFEKSGIPVDTHILRVTRRLGAVRGATPSEAQRELALSVPKKLWSRLNPVLVQHGMNLCVSKSPDCLRCPVESLCLRKGIRD